MSDESKKEPFDLAKIGKEYQASRKTTESIRTTTNKAFKPITDAVNQFKSIITATNAITKPTLTGMQRLESMTITENMLSQYESPAYRLMREFGDYQKYLNNAIGLSTYGAAFKAITDSISSYNAAMSEMRELSDKLALTTPDIAGESFRSLHDSLPAIWRTFRTPGVCSMMDALEAANNSLQQRCGEYAALERLIQDDEEEQKKILGVSSQLFATGKMLAALNYDSIGAHLGLERPVFNALENSVSKTLFAYSNSVTTFEKIRSFIDFPDFIMPIATDGIYRTARTLNCLQSTYKGYDIDPIQIDGDDECVELLELHVPKLVTMYKGAIECMKSNNSDKKRHVLISLRELYSWLIRILAPEASVNQWINNQPSREPFVNDKNKPTRAAKFKYISNRIKNSDLAEYMNHSSSSLTILFNILNKLHQPEITLTDYEIWMIIFEAEAKIKSLIMVAKGN